MIKTKLVHICRQRATTFALAAIVLLAGVLYAPSLSGSFVLDDSANLQNLQNIHDAAQIPEVLLYVISGGAGPTGRPLALLSFALQHESYPARPFDFKLVNIFLHLANGLLAYLLLVRLIPMFRNDLSGSARWFALAIAGVWLLHPMHVSTVAYAVQRMNLLAGFFMLAGCLAYLQARRLRASAPRPAKLLAWVVLPVCAVLGVLSKETAAGLLFVLLLVEFGFPSAPRPGWWQTWRVLVLVIPLLIFLGMLALFWQELIVRGYELKPFSLSERLLSQPRVLFAYLRVILVPASNAIGLFHDDFIVSRTILQPWTSLPALLGIMLLAVAAWRLRKKLPLVSVGIGWFFASHIIESTIFPIELYFEHRNYIPALGILLAAAELLNRAWQYLNARSMRLVFRTALVLYAAYIGFLTASENLLWGDPVRQAHVWAAENPASRRAQTWKLSLLDAIGEREAAMMQLEKIQHHFPDPAFAVLTHLEMSCDQTRLEASALPSLAQLTEMLSREQLSIGPTNVIENVLHRKEFKECNAVPAEYLEKMILTLMENKNFQSKQGLLLTQLARANALLERPDQAIELIEQAVATEPTVERAMQTAVWLAYAGMEGESRRYLALAKDLMRIPAIELLAYSDRINYVNHVLAQRNGNREQQNP